MIPQLTQLWDNDSKSPRYFNCREVDTVESTIKTNEGSRTVRFFYTKGEYGSMIHNSIWSNVLLLREFKFHRFQASEDETEESIKKMIADYRIAVWINSQGWFLSGFVVDMIRLVNCSAFGLRLWPNEPHQISLDADSERGRCAKFDFALYNTLIKDYFKELALRHVRVIKQLNDPVFSHMMVVGDILEIWCNSEEAFQANQRNINAAQKISMKIGSRIVDFSKEKIRLARAVELGSLAFGKKLLDFEPNVEQPKDEKKSDMQQFQEEEKFNQDNLLTVTHKGATQGDDCCVIL